jgi:hypothetical protein
MKRNPKNSFFIPAHQPFERFISHLAALLPILFPYERDPPTIYGIIKSIFPGKIRVPSPSAFLPPFQTRIIFLPMDESAIQNVKQAKLLRYTELVWTFRKDPFNESPTWYLADHAEFATLEQIINSNEGNFIASCNSELSNVIHNHRVGVIHLQSSDFTRECAASTHLNLCIHRLTYKRNRETNELDPLEFRWAKLFSRSPAAISRNGCKGLRDAILLYLAGITSYQHNEGSPLRKATLNMSDPQNANKVRHHLETMNAQTLPTRQKQPARGLFSAPKSRSLVDIPIPAPPFLKNYPPRQKKWKLIIFIKASRATCLRRS